MSMKMYLIVTLLLVCLFSYCMNTKDVNGNQKEYPDRGRSAFEANNHNSLNLLTPPENHTASGSCQKQKLERGTWFYPQEFNKALNKTLLKDLVNRNINVIYFSIGDETNLSAQTLQRYRMFIELAKRTGINAYAVVLEDPSFVNASSSDLRERFENVIKLTKNMFNVFIVDVEPQVVPGSNPENYLHKYVTMSFVLRKVADKHHVKYYDTIPDWYQTKMKNIGIVDGLNSLSSSGIYLLDYSSNVTQIITRLDPIKSDVNKCIVLNFKISPSGNEPYLKSSQIPSIISYLKARESGYGIFKAIDLVALPQNLFS
jgi:hypothetical protein